MAEPRQVLSSADPEFRTMPVTPTEWQGFLPTESGPDRQPQVSARPVVIACCGLVMACGLLLLALANTALVYGRSGYWLFWVGLLLIFAPVARRLIACASRTEGTPSAAGHGGQFPLPGQSGGMGA